MAEDSPAYSRSFSLNWEADMPGLEPLLQPNLEPTCGRTFSVWWWLIAWRSFAGGLMLALVAGAGEATDASPMITSWLPEALVSTLGAILVPRCRSHGAAQTLQEIYIALVPRS